MATLRASGIVLVSAALLCATAGAQDVGRRRVGFTAGAAGTYGNLTGGDFDGTRAAPGYDANAGVVLGRWQLGVGYDRSTHARDGSEGNFVVSNVYVEPRFMFARDEREWTPYVAARAGRATASYEGFLGLTDDATGYIAGVGGGLLWAVGARVQFDGGIHYARLSHDYDTGGYADAEKGGRTSVRIGIRVSSSR